ncbi:hypothetical protein Tco_0024444 [Tanacetum coccineum]
MDTTRAQQKELDDELEPTLQVALDALKLTLFYNAFEIIADVPEIYMQEFWVTVSRHHSLLHFKLNGKSHTVNVDNFRDMLKIRPKLPGQEFEEPPLEEEILSFIRDLGHTGEIKFLSDVNVNHMHQPWRSLASIIKKRLSGKTTALENLVYQVENKNSNKNNDMYYPRFTKVIVDYFMTKDQAILRRNKMFWHYARDDFMFTTIRVISKHQDTQVYGAILPQHLTNQAMLVSEAYMTYRAYATGEKTPKPKSTKKKADSESSPKTKLTQASKGKRIKTLAKEDKPAKKKQFATKSKGLTVLSEVYFTEANNEIALEIKKRYKLTALTLVAQVMELTYSQRFLMRNNKTYLVQMKELVTNQRFPIEDDNDEHDSENDNDDEDDDQENVSGETESDNDGDDFMKKKNQDGYIMFMGGEQEDQEDEEMYGDLNLNLDKRDVEMTDAQTNQETEEEVSSLETELSELKQTNQFAKALSSIPGIVDNYLASQMKDAVNVAVQLKSNKLREDTQAENDEFLKQIDSNIKAIIKDQVKAQVSKIMPKVEKYVTESLGAEVLARSSNQPQTSYAAATSLSEFKLKKIFIDKIEENKSLNISEIQKNLYNTLIESYNSDKDLFASYGDVVTLKRGRDDQDKDEEPSAGANRGTTRRRSGTEESSIEATQKESKSISSSKEEPLHQEFNTGNDDVSPVRETIAVDERLWNPSGSQTPDRTQSLFNEFLATPIDFSAFIMNRLKLNNLTQDVLTGPTYDLMKGTCKSVVELEYHLEEVFKATNDQLDWHNPEGRPYPHDLSKPLPLIQNARGRQVIPFDHFINNDLEYLKGGSLSQKYTTSLTKTKVADYGHAYIEFDTSCLRQACLLGNISLGTKTSEILWICYQHGNFKRCLLKTQDHCCYQSQDHGVLWLQTFRRDYCSKAGRSAIQLTNLNLDERFALNVALRLYTRCIVIQERVEDLQLAVESYQKKINLSRPDSYRSDLKKMTPYTAYHNIQGIIYQDDMDKNRLMRTDELHKFSDGTLNHVRTALNDIVTRIQMEYLPKRKWSKQDKQRAWVMINSIDKKLRDRRLMRSLEKFVGGRPYGGDLRLLQRTI